MLKSSQTTNKTRTCWLLMKPFVTDVVKLPEDPEMLMTPVPRGEVPPRLNDVRIVCSLNGGSVSPMFGQVDQITKGIFIAQFFNTAILLLIVNANFKNTGLPFHQIFKGQYNDFTEKWYSEVGGTIVKTMTINAVVPLIEFFMFFALRNFLRLLDRGFSKNVFQTKKKTIQQYVDVYSGSVYQIHYRYSGLMVAVYVCFMYGLGLPILFPIALLTFCCLYASERLAVCYLYKQPPMYDDKLNNTALNTMQWAPVLMLTFGYWQMTNRQIFKGVSFPKQFSGEVAETGHNMWKQWSLAKWDHSAPMLTLFILVILGLFVGGIIKWIISKIIGRSLDVDLNVDEDLPHYMRALEQEDKDWWVAEENNCRKVLGFKMIDDKTLANITANGTSSRTIEGVHCYDLLANPNYVQDFQYVPADVPNRDEYINDDDDDDENNSAQSDLVRLVLCMGFMSENSARNFSFHKDAYVALRKKAASNV